MNEQDQPQKVEITSDANVVGHGNIVQLVKAEGDSTIQNIVQQVFIGDYERLRDAYMHPWPIFERVDLKHFVGREWLLAEVDAFLRDHDRGYFILEAEAGLGKTTFLAWLVKARGDIHHFVELAPGLEGIGRGLKNLAAQIVLAYHMNAWEAEGVLPGTAVRPDYLLNLLKEAADKRQEGEKIVLVVDALDEAGTPYNQNVLGLPNVLPKGVFIIVSQRPVPVTLQVDTSTTPRCVFHLSASSDGNRADMRRFLERTAVWPGIAHALQSSDYTLDQFIATLLEKCRGVWIYLHYVVHEIERGERSPLDLDALPDGMTQYYACYWARWRDADEAQWCDVYLPLLATLAAEQETVTVERLAEWTNVKLPEQMLRRLLNEKWRPFLVVAAQDEHDHYGFYHATLREFFEGKAARDNLTSAELSFVDELVTATRQAHNRLAEHYLIAWGGLETGLPGLQDVTKRDVDGGYGLRHLAAHLEGAKRTDDLHHLLAVETNEKCNSWYEAKDAAGDTGGFLADVARAWQLAEEAGLNTQNVRERGRAIGLQNRYALINASVNSLATQIPPCLLVTLVEKGIWPPVMGLAYARRITVTEARSEALASLAPCLPERLLREALVRALEIGKSTFGIDNRSRAIAGLVPQLAKLGHPTEALAVAREIDGYWRAKVLAELAPGLSEQLLQEALGAAQEICYERAKVEALAGLAPYLPEPLRGETLREALTVARKAIPKIDLAEAVAYLAPHLPKPLLGEALDAALAAVQGIKSGFDRAIAIAYLAPYLPEPLLGEALDAALAAVQGIKSGFDRVVTIAYLAPYLTEPLLREELIIAQKIDNQEMRIKALVRLASSVLPGPLRNEAINVALAAMRGAKAPSACAEVLAELAPHLSEPLLLEALAVARKISYERDRAKALAGLARYLPDSLAGEALSESLAIARRVGDSYHRAKALAELAAYLPELLPGEALRAAREVEDLERRVEMLAELAVRLPEPLLSELLREALMAVQDIGDSVRQASALAGLSPYLPEQLLGEALVAARRMKDDYLKVNSLTSYFCAKALAGLGLHLPEPLKSEVLREALVAAERIFLDSSRAELLVGLAPYLPEPLLGEAMKQVHWGLRREGNNKYCERVLAGLAPYLPDLLLRKALVEAKKCEDSCDRAKALAVLAPYLPESLLMEALVAARGISGSFGRPDDCAEALAALVPQLAKLGYPAEALAAVQEIKHDYFRAEALARLAPYLPEPLLREALTALREISYATNRARALVGLAPYLPRPLLSEGPREALVEIWRMDLVLEYRVEMLAGLAPYLPELLLSESLREVLTKAVNDDDRAKALVGLSMHLPDPLLDEALAIARKIEGDDYRAGALAALTQPLSMHLPPIRLYSLWCETLHVLASRTRKCLLSDLQALSPLVAALGEKDAIVETFRAIQDIGRWWP